MKFIGFNLNKVMAEKLSSNYKGVKINTKIDINGIDLIESVYLKEEGIVRVKFTYSIEYSQNAAKIEIAGDILLGAEKKQAQEIVDGWKDKKISEELRILIFNLILKKANVRALELEEQLNLPLHIPMPSLKRGKK